MKITLFRSSSLRIKALILSLITVMTSEAVLGLQLDDNSFSTIFVRSTIFLISLYSISCYLFSFHFSSKLKVSDLITCQGLIFLFLVIVWVGNVLVTSVISHFNFHSHFQNIFKIAIPYAVPTMLIHVICGSCYGLLVAIISSLVAAMYYGDHILSLYVFISAITACLNLRKVRSRSAFVRASIWIGGISVMFGLTTIILSSSATITDITAQVIASAICGILTFLFTTGFVPFLETVGGYVTDIKLIEMATLDHPLLKELSIQAPGTWNHSNALGMMAETAADAIGANPVVARVGSYFHDIGKIKKPLYFVENQMGAENKHDKLPASMSSLIIRTHVKDGIELAKKHNLPKVLIDMIEQHHGTSLIEFFYNKAIKELETQGKGDQTVDKSHYMYSGPKPQTREAGIIMLADSIESSSRVLADPTADRIQGMVQKKINKIFASGQLDECELTLKDLHKIAKCFIRVLSGILHHRVSYGEPVEKVGAVNTESKEENKEELKRLGSE